MKVPTFELERWQSVWENQVEINISESGVLPLTLAELVDDKDALARLLATPLGYPQTNGSEETRTRVAALYPGASAGNVLVTSGCAEANFLITWSLLEPGTEAIFMVPNYVQVGQLAGSFGAKVHELRLREELRWGFDPDELRRIVNQRTRLIAICNPNNPTGAVMSDAAMTAVCECASQVGAWVLADEVYRGAEFSGELTPTFWGRYERVLCTGGLSKAYSLPGLRIGWIVGQPEMVEKLWRYHDYTTIGISLLSDRLAALAISPAVRQRIRQRVQRVLNENYPIVQAWTKRHADHFRHIPPVAGGIAWIGYDFDWAAAEMAEELRRGKGVLIVPGPQFGTGFDKFFRIGFAGDHEHLRQGLQRFDDLLAEATAMRAVRAS